MRPSYKLSVEAKEDLRRIYNYGFKNWGEKQADKYYFAFFEAFDLIAKNPLIYPSVEHIREGYRRCICGVDVIYFRIQNSHVEIMTIIGQQDI